MKPLVQRMLFSLALVTCLATAAISAEVESGAIEGTREQDVTVYKGVPFAQPPIGALRWREPLPAGSWSGVRQTTSFAPACMQTGTSMPGEAPPITDEDCLYLNIWTPASAPGSRLPVLVWIYGGGFTNGSASMPLYWGDALARKGIVVVTVAYRTGAFGFLAHPQLTAESIHHSSGNYGLLDQIAALKWVQRNIAAFGGDASRVTVAGQSAGAMSVSILMASPLTRGLFQRAIGQSGGFFEPVQLAPRFMLANAERDGVAFAQAAGANSLDALRRLPAAALLKADAGNISHPVIDHLVTPETPFEVFSAGRQHDVPLLVGTNAEEARALVDVTKVTASTFAAGIQKSFGQLPPELLAAYPFTTDEQARQARIAFETDLRFGWDVWAWARLHASHKAQPVYVYRFAHTPPFPLSSPYANWGASHFAELWYVFSHLNQQPWKWAAQDHHLADVMSSYWVNFIKTGNPNAETIPRWPAFNGVKGPVHILEAQPHVGEIQRLNALQVFDAVYAKLRASPKPH